MSKSDWKVYEIYITRHFKKLFPDATITHNVKRPGLISKVLRQIDILIEARVTGFELSIIVDCKYFNKKVDVKEVESFLSFLLDLKASKGVMITNVGYTEAALNRATYDTQDVELRIIDFKDLDKFQAFIGIPYAGNYCAIVPAPPGWIIDAKSEGPYLASLYPAGLSQREAIRTEGFMYFLFSYKDKRLPDLNALLEMQDATTRSAYRAPKIEYSPSNVKRPDCVTRLRIIRSHELSGRVDCTLFMDFFDVIAFITLLSPEKKFEEYLKKLEWVGQKLSKGKVIHDATGKPASILKDRHDAAS